MNPNKSFNIRMQIVKHHLPLALFALFSQKYFKFNTNEQFIYFFCEFSNKNLD